MNTFSLLSIIVCTHLLFVGTINLDIKNISAAQIVSADSLSAKVSARSITNDAFMTNKRKMASVYKNKKLIAKN